MKSGCRESGGRRVLHIALLDTRHLLPPPLPVIVQHALDFFFPCPPLGLGLRFDLLRAQLRFSRSSLCLRHRSHPLRLALRNRPCPLLLLDPLSRLGLLPRALSRRLPLKLRLLNRRPLGLFLRPSPLELACLAMCLGPPPLLLKLCFCHQPPGLLRGGEGSD